MWRAIPGFEKYEVSTDARVRRGRHVLRPQANGWYPSYALSKGGRSKRIGVHRLVLMAFDRLPEPGEVARHLDGDPTNNHLDNLAWGTHKQNWEDRRRHQAALPYKLTLEQVASVFTDTRAQTVIAEDYGVSQSLVSDIKRGKRYAHVTKNLKAGRKNKDLRKHAATICKMHSQGKTLRDIASCFGTSSSAIHSILKRSEYNIG